MKYRNNRAGSPVSILGYGCMRFSRSGGSPDLPKAEKEIMTAIESGVNYFDTAYIYPGSEALLGEVLERFDHRYLNELAPFSEGVNPTAEQLARIIYEALVAKAPFAETATARLAAITVWESPKSSVTYTPE